MEVRPPIIHYDDDCGPPPLPNLCPQVKEKAFDVGPSKIRRTRMLPHRLQSLFVLSHDSMMALYDGIVKDESSSFKNIPIARRVVFSGH